MVVSSFEGNLIEIAPINFFIFQINYNLVWKTALEAPDLRHKITKLLESVEVSKDSA